MKMSSTAYEDDEQFDIKPDISRLCNNTSTVHQCMDVQADSSMSYGDTLSTSTEHSLSAETSAQSAVRRHIFDLSSVFTVCRD